MQSTVPRRGLCDTSQPVAPARQRHGLLFLIFCIWFLSIAFQRFDLVETYSLDNLLAPLLCVAALALPQLRNSAIASQRQKTLFVLLVVYCLFWLASVLPVLESRLLVQERGWAGLREGFYLFAVALFVRDGWSFRIAKSLLVILTMMAAVSTLLHSIGWLDLPVERYEASRVGLEWLPKAVGLFSNFGDVAILFGFTAVVSISHARDELAFGLGTWWGRLFVWLSLLAGIAGTQSRNVVLTMLAAIGAYWVFGVLSRSRSATRVAVVGVLGAVGISVIGALAVFGGDMVSTLSGWGGATASKSATWRLQTYGQALSLIGQYSFFGVTADVYYESGSVVATLHNMWLRVLLQGGMFRFAALLALFWVVAKGGLRNLGADHGRARDASVVMATVVAILIATQFYGGMSVLMWVMLGFLASFRWVSQDATLARLK